MFFGPFDTGVYLTHLHAIAGKITLLAYCTRINWIVRCASLFDSGCGQTWKQLKCSNKKNLATHSNNYKDDGTISSQ